MNPEQLMALFRQILGGAQGIGQGIGQGFSALGQGIGSIPGVQSFGRGLNNFGQGFGATQGQTPQFQGPGTQGPGMLAPNQDITSQILGPAPGSQAALTPALPPGTDLSAGAGAAAATNAALGAAPAAAAGGGLAGAAGSALGIASLFMGPGQSSGPPLPKQKQGIQPMTGGIQTRFGVSPNGFLTRGGF